MEVVFHQHVSQLDIAKKYIGSQLSRIHYNKSECFRVIELVSDNEIYALRVETYCIEGY